MARTLRIADGEGRVTASLVALMFAATAGITIGESGIHALFFDRVGAEALPLMYLLQGGATFAAMLALTGILGRFGSRRANMVAPAALGALVLGERAVLFVNVRWIYPLLWVTVAVATLVQAIFLWGTAGAVLDTRQAKRLFPIVAAGGILGAIAGGLVTRPLARLIGAEDLLLVWAGALIATFLLCRAALGPAPAVLRRRAAHRHTSAVREMARGFGFVRRSKLLAWMTVASVLFSVLFFTLYLPYAQAASDRFTEVDELAGFFGLLWAGVTTAAFLVSILLTNRLFAWFGMAATIIVLPFLYAASFGVLLFGSAFATLVAARFVVGVWLQGVASPGWETLVNVIPDEWRDRTRAFFHGGPTQIGTAIAGIVALVGQASLTPRQFAAIGLVAATMTALATIRIRRSYADALVDALRADRPQVFERSPIRGMPCALSVGADVEELLNGLTDPTTFDAATEAVRLADPTGVDDKVRAFVRTASTGALSDWTLAHAIPSDGDEMALLRDAVRDRGRRMARSALWAATMLGERRAAMQTAIENLEGAGPQRARAVETLEAAGDPELVRPLLAIWEPTVGATNGDGGHWLPRVLEHEDAFIRRCAEFVHALRQGGIMSRSVAGESVFDHMLFLRELHLFSDIEAEDLERVAVIAEERRYVDGEVIAAEGEPGEELHIVIEGTIRVIHDRDGSERELARRTAGDVVAEISIITQTPRMASLLADGSVRTLRIGRREFNSMLRERPAIGRAVMRMLAGRLTESACESTTCENRRIMPRLA